jgi:hypothetical protein
MTLPSPSNTKTPPRSLKIPSRRSKVVCRVRFFLTPSNSPLNGIPEIEKELARLRDEVRSVFDTPDLQKHQVSGATSLHLAVTELSSMTFVPYCSMMGFMAGVMCTITSVTIGRILGGGPSITKLSRFLRSYIQLVAD